jgi:replicative DNA helicase
MLDSFSEHVSKPDVNPFEATKLFKDNIIQMYGELSKLQTVHKLETERDFFIIKDKASIVDFSKTIVDYISSEYSFFKTGFKLFDKYVDGMESSSVHVFAATSNHGKSLFLVNLVRKIINKNLDNFSENDAVLYVTMEDKHILSTYIVICMIITFLIQRISMWITLSKCL